MVVRGLGRAFLCLSVYLSTYLSAHLGDAEVQHSVGSW